MRNNKIIIAGILLILGSTFANAKSVEFYEKNPKELEKILKKCQNNSIQAKKMSKSEVEDCNNANTVWNKKQNSNKKNSYTKKTDDSFLRNQQIKEEDIPPYMRGK